MSKVKLIAASALALGASLGVASAQDLPEGRVYAFHSKASGACPALDWYVTVRAGNTLSGMISWDEMQSMAYATGSYDAAKKTFAMSAQEIRGQGRTATIDGQVRGDGWLIANIHGQNVTCLGIPVPWFQETKGSG